MNTSAQVVVCSICGQEVPRSKAGPHKSAHVRQAKARYIYKPGIKHPFEVKPCRRCGKVTLIQRRNEFCSPRCGQLVGEENPGWKGRAAKPTTARMRAHRVITTMTSCERCGKTGRLHRHHIDEDTFNNDPSNLVVLCVPCHKKAHRKPRSACPICGREARRPDGTYCSQACFGAAQRGQKKPRKHAA